MLKETNMREITLNVDNFLMCIKNILRTRCYVKFDVGKLISSDSFLEGEFRLTPRKRIELLIAVEEMFNVAFSKEDLTSEQIKNVATLYCLISKKMKTHENSDSLHKRG